MILTKNKLGEWEQVAGGMSNSFAPIGAIFSFMSDEIPTGYLLCNGQAVSKTDYAELYSVIGSTFGETSTTFNVPDLKGKFAEGTPNGGTLGASIAAGLPNITGSVVANGLIGSNPNGTGALEVVTSNSIAPQNGNGPEDAPAISFDASKSNSIYGNSTTVQPPAVCVNYIIKAKDINMSSAGQALADRVTASGLYAHGNSEPFLDNQSIQNYLTSLDSEYKFATFTVAPTSSLVTDKVVNGNKWFNYNAYRQNNSWFIRATDSGVGQELYFGACDASTPISWVKNINTSDLASVAGYTGQYNFNNGDSININLSSTSFNRITIYNHSSMYSFVVHEWGSEAVYHWIVGTALPSRITATYSNYRLTLKNEGFSDIARLVVEAQANPVR